MSIKDSTKNIFLVLLNRILSIGLVGVFWLIIANIVEPSSFGEITYIISIASIASTIAMFGAPQSIVLFRAENKQEISNTLNSFVALFIAFTAIVLSVINPLAALACICFAFYTMTERNLLGEKKYRKQLEVGLIKSVLILVIPILLYFMIDIAGIIIGFSIANVVVTADYIRRIKKRYISFTKIKNNFKILVHNFSVDLSIVLPRYLDKIIIVPLFGFFVTGIYQFNLQILWALEVVPIATQLFLLSEEAGGVIHRKIEKYLVILAAIISIIAIIFAPMFVEFFFEKYSVGILSLQILLLSLVPQTISSVYLAKLQAKRSEMVGYSILVRIIPLVVLIFVLGSVYEIEGLALAYLISSILTTLFFFIVYQRKKLY